MNIRANVYVGMIIVASIGVAATFQWNDLVAMPARHVAGLTSFILLGVASEVFAIDFAVGANRAKSSISFVALLACSLYFPPAAAVLAAAAMQLIADGLVQKRKLWVVCFNTAQGTLAIAIALWAYALWGGVQITEVSVKVTAFVGMVLSLFAVNSILVSGLVSLRQGKQIITVVRSVVGSNSANLLYGMLASPIAIVMAVVYDRLYIGGLFLMLMPLLLIRYSYLSKVQLQQANRDLLKVLIKTIETRDPYTSGHSLRVSHLARLIAEDLGLSRRRVEQVETAGLLHDIGKIDTIYTAIIQKPSDLTEDERRVIKTHAVKGAEFLKSMTSLSDAVIEGVRHHHERYDGMGYPDKLSGDAIPLYSRIIMICDAIDAMLSDRPYRSALTIDRVQDELLRCAGTQFDPEIVGVIIRCGTLSRALELVRAQGSSPEMVAVGAGGH